MLGRISPRSCGARTRNASRSIPKSRGLLGLRLRPMSRRHPARDLLDNPQRRLALMKGSGSVLGTIESVGV